METIAALLAESCHRDPRRVALMAPKHEPLSYAGVRDVVESLVQEIRERGIGSGDRVALVLPDGLLTALTFLAVSSTCAAAPLNPAYRESELRFYLTDLKPKGVIVPEGADSPVRSVAAQMNLPVWGARLEQVGGRTAVRLSGASAHGPASGAFATADDIALILHTSGTTSRPKMVALTGRNLATSARNVARVLQLDPEDRCLSVMPFFHIHGLVAGLLSSLSAGGAVICTTGFSAVDFFGWLTAHAPTWYTAVPTMHQAIVAGAMQQPGGPVSTRLRFIRSASAALPRPTMEALESEFGVPVIEAYGMTEASHQIASNPLPPATRKPGTVGLAAGPDVAIMHPDRAELIATGATGEIVLRGANVTAGYLDNPEANHTAFAAGWFRTGDVGYLDDDGYVTVTGRIKEIINRGGEKIAPREVDEALLSHPAVVQAVAFAMPDARLGEEVAAAVVLRAPGTASVAELQAHVADRLADFKVPRRIVMLETIPKGPTGKIQRIGLAASLGLTEGRSDTASSLRTGHADPAIETRIRDLWCDLLQRSDIGAEEHYLDVGGDSLQATRLINRLNTDFGIELRIIELFDAETIRAQAFVVERKIAERQPGSPRPPGIAARTIGS